MSLRGSSIIDLVDLSPELLFSLYESVENARLGKFASGQNLRSHIALIFFEDSTRTRMSFEAAAYKLGLFTSYFDHRMGTSLAKGESLEDTVLNIASMTPSLLVIRCSDDFPLRSIAEQVKVPVINGGWGKLGHPTQALLDVYTLWRRWNKSLAGKRVLFVGDIRHSRVAASHCELLQRLGAQVGFCAPKGFLPSTATINSFHSLDEGAKWADAIVALRVQTERHHGDGSWDLASFRKNFAITQDRLKTLKEDLFILHPGPFNDGVELDSKVLKDSRSLVYEQVENGVFVRAALMNEILDLGVIRG